MLFDGNDGNVSSVGTDMELYTAYHKPKNKKKKKKKERERERNDKAL